MDSQTVITLFKAADRSSFLHEMGHFFLESRRRLSLIEGADERAREDAGWRMSRISVTGSS
jgi:hypothetical protein